ncbi:MAG: DedA family protein [Muribaculaceae bacterium]|nr:DedA family protein [Muribaculaceae bacterium]
MMKNKKLTLLVVVVATLLVVAAAVVAVTHGNPNPTPSSGELSRDIYFWLKDHIGYAALVLLMAIESSIVPLPSEVVVPPAAYFALQHDSDLNVWLVIAAATVGAYLGSVINYGLSVLLGRPIIYAFADSRLGHLLRLSGDKLRHAEDFFQRKGSLSVFVGRLLPVVRHLISIPAGLSQMNFARFSLYTFLGAGLWNVVLAALGWMLYLAVPDDALFFDQLEHYSHYLKIAGFALLAAVAAYIVWKIKKREPKNNPTSSH